MLDEKAVREKIKHLEDDIKYLKVGYETLGKEIKQIKQRQHNMNKKLEKISRILGL